MDAASFEHYVQLITDSVYEMLNKQNPLPAEPSLPQRGNNKRLITEADVLEMIKQGQKELSFPAGMIITALAEDALHKHGMRIVPEATSFPGE